MKIDPSPTSFFPTYFFEELFLFVLGPLCDVKWQCSLFSVQEVHYFAGSPFAAATGIPDIFRSILIARFPFPATAVLLLLLLFTHTARCQTRPANSALVSLWGSAKKILYLLFSHIHQHRIRFLSNIEKYLWHAFHTPCYTYSWGQQRLCLIHQCDGYILIFSIAVDDQPLLHLVTRWVEQMHGGVIRLQNVGHSTAPFSGGKSFSFSLSPQHYGHILAQTKQSKQ